MKYYLLIGFIFFAFYVSAQEELTYIPETDPATLKKLEEWQNVKFGLLMHWGPYSQWGVVESWSICAEDEGWCRRNNENYIEYKKQYEDLQKTFNPVKFNPEKWAKAARDAGMRYVVITTKHHDGFCMFDTKQTDYKITDKETPFSTNPRANVTKEIFEAFRKEGFLTGAYFSKPDWHSDYYWWKNFATPDRNVNYNIKSYPERWQKFVEFTQNQIDELMTDYGRVDILWLDGGWVRKKTDDEIKEQMLNAQYANRPQSQDIDMPLIVKNARAKQPGLIVVDRAVTGQHQNYLTPENQVPNETLPYPWETCMPMATSWSYVPNDKYKSPNKIIHLLVDIVAKGGNFLLNIGPGPDGEWHQEAYDRLNDVGKWMKINSEAIYNTHPLPPYKEGKICFTQLNDGTTYAIYLADENENKIPKEIILSSIMPGDNAEVYLLGFNKKLNWKKVENIFRIVIPEELQSKPPCENAWVLKISIPN